MSTIKAIITTFARKGKNAQHVTLVTDIQSSVPQEVATKYGFGAQWTVFNTAANNEVSHYKPDKGFLNTAKIEATDGERDDAYMYYWQMINATANYCPDAEKKEAGKTLVFLFREAGGSLLTVQDYTSETAALNDLVQRMEDEPYASALTTLGMEDAPAVIKAKNDAFTEAYRERYTPERERAFSANLKDLRTVTDDAFDQLAQAINAIYAANEIVTKDEETRTALGKVIDDINGAIVNYKKVTGSSSSSGTGGETPDTPEEPAVTPAITSVYNVEGRDPEKPLFFWRTDHVGMGFQGFTLKGQGDTLEHVIGLVEEYDRFTEWIKPEAISNVTETSCQFAMVEDLASGKYKIRVETYDGGSPLVVEYPDLITLDL